MSSSIERPVPPYEQLARILRDMIKAGDFLPGDRVPSERRLSEDYDVARATAAKALAALRSEGLVEPRAGVGTIVCAETKRRSTGDATDLFDARSGITSDSAADVGASVLSPQERHVLMRQTGRIRAEDEHSRIIACERRDPPSHVRAALGADEGEQAIRRARVVSRSGRPIELSESWFHGSIAEACPALLREAKIPEGTTHYVEQHLGVVAGEARETVLPAIADEEAVKSLHLEESAAIIATQVTILTTENRPLVFEVYKQPKKWTRSYPLPPHDD